MESSTMKKVLDAILSTAKVSGVHAVTDDAKVWSQLNQKDVPRIYVNLGPVTATRIAFSSVTSEDMEATAQVTLDGVVQTRTPGALATTMDSIMSKVITAMESLTVSGVTVLDCYLVSMDYDKDAEANYGIFRGVFRVRYLYNHLAP